MIKSRYLYLLKIAEEEEEVNFNYTFFSPILPHTLNLIRINRFEKSL